MLARFFFPLIAVASLAVLATALIAQYGFGLEPCELCEYERVPYWTAAAIAIAAILIPGTARRDIAWLLAVIFVASAGLAFYHTGVEQHWWHAATACGRQSNTLPLTFEAFKATPLTPILKPCDSLDWAIFGLSITVYNTLTSLVLAGLSLVAARTLPGLRA